MKEEEEEEGEFLGEPGVEGTRGIPKVRKWTACKLNQPGDFHFIRSRYRNVG